MELQDILKELEALELSGLYERDWLEPGSKSGQELAGVFAVADALRALRDQNYATVIFRSGLALWEGPEEEGFAPFAAGASMLGLRPVRLERLDGAVLAGAGPDVLCARTDCRELCQRLYQSGAVSQRPLSLPRDTALPLVLFMLHESGGIQALWNREAPLPLRETADLGVLTQRFGLRLGPRQAREEERWQLEALGGYVSAAMILLGKCPEPAGLLKRLWQQGQARRTI